jgi:hypothetical protein
MDGMAILMLFLLGFVSIYYDDTWASNLIDREEGPGKKERNKVKWITRSNAGMYRK